MRKNHHREPLTIATIHLKSGDIKAPVYVIEEYQYIDLPKPCGIVWLRNRGKHKKGYYKIYAGFDIETTNKITEEYRHAYMYIWQMAICTERQGYVYMGRTWEAFEWLIKCLKAFYSEERANLIIFDANFGFEFQFIRKHLKWNDNEYDFFAKEERKPLVATTDNIQFRECLTISGGSLAQLANDYTATQKLKGDLDYKIERNSHTKLTLQEYQYCINDVVILAEWSEFIFNQYIIPDRKVPLTKTGLLRSEVKARLVEVLPDTKEYLQYIKSAFPSETTYKMWFRYLFRGGYVHSNFTLTNIEIKSGMMPYDITSSYPARMNLSYYPVTPFKSVVFNRKYLTTKCCILYCRFYDIESTTVHSIESQHKLIKYADDLLLDNGRMYQCSMVEVLLTELDFDCYTKFYKWSKMEVLACHIAKRGKLPRYIRDVLNKHYIAKAKLKADGLQDTPLYAITKSGVNAAFGLMVTRISLDTVTYSGDDWILKEHDIDYQAEVEGQILLPQWGIYVAAAARHELLSMVYDITTTCGNVVAYCDTDSIKCLSDDRIPAIIERYNQDIAAQLKSAGLTDPAFHDLGMFDIDLPRGFNAVSRFKTLGAKRYLTEYLNTDSGDKIIKATIAGLPKSTIKHQLDAEGGPIDPFDLFDIDGMVILAENSDKLTSHYNDEYTCGYVDGELMEELSSVALYDIPFSMFTDKTYYNLIFDDNRRKKV